MKQENWIYTSRRPDATRKLGEKLGQMAPQGTVFALVGDLGIGKTHFVQGFAVGMGVHAMRASSVDEVNQAMAHCMGNEGPHLIEVMV